MPEAKQQPENARKSASSLVFVSLSWNSSTLKSMTKIGPVYKSTLITATLPTDRPVNWQ